MNDKMNELVQFSPVAGKLVLENVSGETSKKVEHENDVHAANGADRTMYVYAPTSGCPDAKQCQVLMVLRDEDSEQSAARLLDQLGLQKLSEEEHFPILFPNPLKTGWNYGEKMCYDNNMDFLGRCFGTLRGSSVGVNGFNGMIYYIAATPGASALLMSMAAHRPIAVPAMMIGAFPEDYRIPADASGVETAAWVCGNAQAEAYLKKANGVTTEEAFEDAVVFYGKNPNCRLITSGQELSCHTVELAWDRLFSLSRRWQNDTNGTYQKRTFFTNRGFTAHVKDASLGCNDGFAHTWYEYIPPQLRGTEEKVPLVFYFHGVNCVPLYGAEQSGWQDVADRENVIVVFPAPARNKAWNIGNNPAMPSDFAFVLALIEHMKQVHPIDETRIYSTGFSMGAMMTHAITAVYPEIFAGAAPCNAFDFAYFKSPAELPGPKEEAGVEHTVQHGQADAKRAQKDYRMPMFQNVGYDDALIASWPITEQTDDVRTKTIARWMDINNIGKLTLDEAALNHIAADEAFYEDDEHRFYHQRWHSKDAGAPVLYEMLTAKRMPHAIVPRQIELAWEFLKKFRRMPDGSLKIED